MKAAANIFLQTKDQGFSLIEVLVSLVILLVGLLALAGLLVHANRVEFEGYQRKQAVIMLQDMLERLAANRNASPCYGISTTETDYLGSAATVTVSACVNGSTSEQTRASDDLNEWDAILQGGAEVANTSSKIGGAMNARGCIVDNGVVNGANQYTVSVAWQAMTPASLGSALSTCAKGSYDSNDELRRVVSASVRIPVLD